MAAPKSLKVMIAVPVYNREWILPDLLTNIQELDKTGVDVVYYFLDDASTDGSLHILQETVVGDDFENPLWPGATIGYLTETEDEHYDRTTGMDGIAHLKTVREKLRQEALKAGVDYVLMLDSDVLLPANALKRLLEEAVYPAVGPVMSTSPAGILDLHNVFRYIKRSPGLYYTPSSFDRMSKGEGFEACGMVSGCVLVHKTALEACSYFGVDTDHLGDDSAFAADCQEKGFEFFVDWDIPALHVMNQDILDLYKVARNNDGSRGVEDTIAALNPKEESNG